jgi:hypothetical protein
MAAMFLTLLAWLSFHLLHVPFYGYIAAKLMLLLVSFAYLQYLLLYGGIRFGFVSISAASLALFLACLGLGFGFTALLGVCLLCLWLVRSILWYKSVLLSLLDGCATLFSLGFAVFAYALSRSLTLAIWCFFLTQSLLCFLPVRLKDWSRADGRNSGACLDAFTAAERAAEAALARLK